LHLVMFIRFPLVILLVLSPISLLAQGAIRQGAAAELYRMNCAVCHGNELQGGAAGSLLIDEWESIRQTDEALAEYIRVGNPERGMPAFGDAMTSREIRSLVVFINEMRSDAVVSVEQKPLDSNLELESKDYRFRVEPVVDGLQIPWALAFDSAGRGLVTERPGRLRWLVEGELSEPINGIPEVLHWGQGGLMDVAFHPNYADNGWIYLVFTEGIGENRGMTSVVRGRIDGLDWQDEELIYRAEDGHFTAARVHFGSRIVFRDGYLWFAIGDRGNPDSSQDTFSPNGNIHRLHDDGRVPVNNSFADGQEGLPTIWSWGHRNPQGLAFHPVNGELWSAEHGPRGGDEVNWIKKGANYGWPVVTHGINYNGTPITEHISKPGMEDPVRQWTPSISVCAIAFYTGEDFGSWKNNLFVGGLRSEELWRLVISDGKVVEEEIVLKGLGRIRDVTMGQDGNLYLVLNSPDSIVRLLPPVD
jgi:glucose/arabinose dehydrogenase